MQTPRGVQMGHYFTSEERNWLAFFKILTCGSKVSHSGTVDIQIYLRLLMMIWILLQYFRIWCSCCSVIPYTHGILHGLILIKRSIVEVNGKHEEDTVTTVIRVS